MRQFGRVISALLFALFAFTAAFFLILLRRNRPEEAVAEGAFPRCRRTAGSRLLRTGRTGRRERKARRKKNPKSNPVVRVTATSELAD